MIFRIVARCADAAPDAVRELVVQMVAFALFLLSPAKRASVARNVSRAGRPATRELVLGIFELHTRNIVEMFASSRWKDERMSTWFEFDGRDVLNRTLAHGKGAIIVTGHIGSWELGAIHLQTYGYNLHVVAGVQMNRFLTAGVKEAKEKRGIQVVSPMDSYRRLIKALASNGVVVLLVDGNVFTGGKHVRLFGETTVVPDGPVRLAKASGAPIIGGYCRRLERERLKIHLEPIADAREVETMSEEEMLARVYGAVERFIAQNVDQWCIFRRMWESTS